jgi:hypothetical protein
MSGLGQVSIGVLAAALLGVAPAGAQTQDACARSGSSSATTGGCACRESWRHAGR